MPFNGVDIWMFIRDLGFLQDAMLIDINVDYVIGMSKRKFDYISSQIESQHPDYKVNFKKSENRIRIFRANRGDVFFQVSNFDSVIFQDYNFRGQLPHVYKLNEW